MKIGPLLGLSLALTCLGALSACGGTAAFSSLTDPDASTMVDPDAGTTTEQDGAVASGECRTSLDCPTGKVCDSTVNGCFDCVADRDCNPGKKCLSHLCVTPVPPCQTNADCAASPAGKVCDRAAGKCVACVVQGDCPANNDCVANACKPYTTCMNSLACPKGQVCNTEAGRCVECLGANDCAADQTCGGNTCRKKCTSDTQCTMLGLLCDLGKGYCVSCVGAGDCKPEQFCSNGTCAPDVCTAGSSNCESNAVVSCRSDGSGFGGPAPCGTLQTCVAAQGTASCKDRLCAPSVVACDTMSEKVIQCSADGLSATTKLDCGAMSQVCVSATCAPVVCQAGKQYCASGTVRKCSAKGEASTLVQTCTAGQYCDAVSATCKALVCVPNMPACNNRIATTCNADGSGYVEGGINCDPKQCSGGMCVNCDAATEVAYNGKCYYLDGSRGVCDAGYTMASEAVLPSIASSFAGKTYKHTVSNNCCVATTDVLQHWGMVSHCNSPGPFSTGDPALGGAGCTGSATPQNATMQLTLCGSL